MCMRPSLFAIAFLFFSLSGMGQTTLLPKQVENKSVGILYKSEWAVDFRLHTNGAALAYNKGKINTYYKTSYYQFELGFISDPRERKQTKTFSNGFSQTTGTLIYGKQNSMFVLRGGYGEKRYWSEKERKKGLAVGWNYEIGPSVALLKPYYLDLIYLIETQNGISTEIRSEKYSDDNADVFLDDNSIYKASGFFRGFGEMGFVPGIQGKLGLHFASGAYDKNVRALEVGVMWDAYIKKIPIMVETANVSNKPYFVNLYLNLHIGRRNYLK